MKEKEQSNSLMFGGRRDRAPENAVSLKKRNPSHGEAIDTIERYIVLEQGLENRH